MRYIYICCSVSHASSGVSDCFTDFVSADNGVSSVDSVFIFQRSAEETSGVSYDAIVVEQWTLVDVGC